MYRDPYQPQGGAFGGLLRALSASFRVGRFFGVEVRLYWIALLIMPLILVPRVDGSFMERSVHTVILTGLLFLVIYAHEMSHIAAGWRYRMHTPLITLSPLGGTAHMATPSPSPKAEAVVALAGPASHLIWLAVFAPLWFFVFDDWYDLLRPDGWYFSPLRMAVFALYSYNLALMIFNLLPFFPMDGGRTLRALLAMRMHPNRATLIATQVGFVGAALFIVGGFVYVATGGGYGGILIALGITNALACVQERRVAKHTAGPYDAGASFEPWQLDPDAWKRSGAGEAKSSSPGMFQRMREKRRERDRQRRTDEARHLEAEVDRILDKLGDVGMAGLTEKEKKTLMKASRSRKR